MQFDVNLQQIIRKNMILRVIQPFTSNLKFTSTEFTCDSFFPCRVNSHIFFCVQPIPLTLTVNCHLSKRDRLFVCNQGFALLESYYRYHKTNFIICNKDKCQKQ